VSGVLVLDRNYFPNDYITVQEAAFKLIKQKAIPLPGATIIATYRAATMELPIPAVLVLKVYVPLTKRQTRHVTNRILFARDSFTCQYCGHHKFGSCGDRDGCKA
jgi:hypothetical protein